jgi:hypothetical protein
MKNFLALATTALFTAGVFIAMDLVAPGRLPVLS